MLAILLSLTYLFFIKLQAQQQQQQELRIFQTDSAIVIDGALDDWASVKEFPVNFKIEEGKVVPASESVVTAKFTYDAKYFYAAIKAADDTFEFPSRAWRYGDGLYLTFLDPSEGNTSNRFYSFGFSIQGKETEAVLVNRDGEYFPETSLREIQVKIIPDAQQKAITYEIAIPFAYIVPFKPFFRNQWGINIIYVDREQGQRKIFELYPDLNYDTELTDKRAGAIFTFVNHAPQTHEFQSTLNGSHFFHDEERAVTCAINSPSENTGWKIRIYRSSAFGNIPFEQDISLQKGMNDFHISLENEPASSSLYVLSVGVSDERGDLKYREDSQYFVLDRDEFGKLNAKAEELKKGELYTKDPIFRESLPTFEIRLEWIKEFMKEAQPFADISYLKLWHDETNTLLKNIEEGKPALFLPGQIARLAHRSAIDNTLQPYSVYIPDDYDPKKPCPLFVTLHGSGVDERSTILTMTKTVAMMSRAANLERNFIIIAPRAQGLSDWYLGNSGKDVLESIDHIKKLYSVDEKNIVLDGFSMGGYGAWRLALLNPDMFKAVIIRSGATAPPDFLKGENILDLLDTAKPLNFCIVHGDMDDAVSVENARNAVKRLKELGVKHIYIEVRGAAHGNYDRWKEIFQWLRRTLIIR